MILLITWLFSLYNALEADLIPSINFVILPLSRFFRSLERKLTVAPWFFEQKLTNKASLPTTWLFMIWGKSLVRNMAQIHRGLMLG